MATKIVRSEKRSPGRYDVWLEDPRLPGGGMVAHRSKLPDQVWADARVNARVAEQTAEAAEESRRGNVLKSAKRAAFLKWVKDNHADDEVRDILRELVKLYVERGLD